MRTEAQQLSQMQRKVLTWAFGLERQQCLSVLIGLECSLIFPCGDSVRVISLIFDLLTVPHTCTSYSSYQCYVDSPGRVVGAYTKNMLRSTDPAWRRTKHTLPRKLIRHNKKRAAPPHVPFPCRDGAVVRHSHLSSALAVVWLRQLTVLL